jgi:guanylate kinase
MSPQPPGKLIIVSGPSGAGKSTVLQKLLQVCPLPLEMSLSATTRPPREGEENGIHYQFLSHEAFEAFRNTGEFLEWKEVFGRGALYGTLRSTVTAGLADGKWVVLEIDVQGALMVLEQQAAITIFLHPGSPEELERRLRRRGTETEESIRRRLEVARQEMEMLSHYQFEVVNRSVDQAVTEICDLLTQQST